ncbi:uncharacterized protein BJ171DRAFT_199101 [Polychytrium aggregatum]|uniref:uncharacterized protein n=1 Tax=Polychytrium aggregatum TaxID=110093 RepID=UPI0022FE7CD5|nr:uncharacterized protein BJ171DRAFT_199101 [Polychytrium aggregatum]KAI9199834.1 hypothetical protein BJ171DRAFT_199101 [Polychytrium aggregatum]
MLGDGAWASPRTQQDAQNTWAKVARRCAMQGVGGSCEFVARCSSLTARRSLLVARCSSLCSSLVLFVRCLLPISAPPQQQQQSWTACGLGWCCWVGMMESTSQHRERRQWARAVAESTDTQASRAVAASRRDGHPPARTPAPVCVILWPQGRPWPVSPPHHLSTGHLAMGSCFSLCFSSTTHDDDSLPDRERDPLLPPNTSNADSPGTTPQNSAPQQEQMLKQIAQTTANQFIDITSTKNIDLPHPEYTQHKEQQYGAIAENIAVLSSSLQSCAGSSYVSQTSPVGALAGSKVVDSLANAHIGSVDVRSMDTYAQQIREALSDFKVAPVGNITVTLNGSG